MKHLLKKVSPCPLLQKVSSNIWYEIIFTGVIVALLMFLMQWVLASKNSEQLFIINALLLVSATGNIIASLVGKVSFTNLLCKKA